MTTKATTRSQSPEGDQPHTVARGLALALLAAIISGAAVFLSAYGVREFPSPAVYTGLRNTLVALALLVLVLRPATIAELRGTSSRQRLGLALLGLIGGSIPFVLFFEGLSQAGAGTAALVQKSLFLWVAVLAVLVLRERLGRGQVAALGLLLAAHLLLGGRGALQFGQGELMVFAATLLWSGEVVLAKRLLSTLSSQLAVTARMTVGATIVLAYLAVTGKIGVLTHLGLNQWLWAVGPSFLLLAYVTTWYAALKRAPATAVTCVLTVGAPITAALTVVAGGAQVRPTDLLGYVGLIAAVVLLVVLTWRSSRVALGRGEGTPPDAREHNFQTAQRSA